MASRTAGRAADPRAREAHGQQQPTARGRGAEVRHAGRGAEDDGQRTVGRGGILAPWACDDVLRSIDDRSRSSRLRCASPAGERTPEACSLDRRSRCPRPPRRPSARQSGGRDHQRPGCPDRPRRGRAVQSSIGPKPGACRRWEAEADESGGWRCRDAGWALALASTTTPPCITGASPGRPLATFGGSADPGDTRWLSQMPRADELRGEESGLQACYGKPPRTRGFSMAST